MEGKEKAVSTKKTKTQQNDPLNAQEVGLEEVGGGRKGNKRRRFTGSLGSRRQFRRKKTSQGKGRWGKIQRKEAQAD